MAIIMVRESYYIVIHFTILLIDLFIGFSYASRFHDVYHYEFTRIYARAG